MCRENEKERYFFTQKPPKDQSAIHIWLGKVNLSHEQHLRQVLSHYLDCPSVNIATSTEGKHYLPDSSLHFNLSDSDDWLAIALSWEAPVGIDIETIRPIDGTKQIILDNFSPNEQTFVNSPNDSEVNDYLGRFWEIWNRKEACLKALGIGLQDNMSHWDCCGEDWIFVNEVWVRSVPMGHNLSAAVAIHL